MFVAQYEQNRIQFVEWDRLTSKEQEASSNAKKETVLSVDSSGRLKTEKGDSAKAETSTELLLQFALTRRGLSFSEIARLRDDLLAQCGAPQADTPEAFAFSILEKRTPSKEDVLLLARMLPLSPSPRDERAKSFSSGASVHGGAVNVRKTCGAFPFSSLAVTSYIRATAPECTFSTFSLLFEDEAKPHKDLQNHSCENYVFPLSNFSGGELWVEGHGPEQRTLEGKEADPTGKRWLHGPLTRDEVDSIFPEGWMPCR
eukprot:s11672_g1.t1